jgi:dihydroorotase
MTKLLIQNGQVIDPSAGVDGKFDVLIQDGKIADLAKPGSITADDAEVIDASGCVVSPGFVELHSHLRDPGFEYKETIQSGTASAVSGGYTTVCCMANTSPVNDNASVTDYIVKKTREVGYCKVHPIGAITKSLKGEELANIAELKEAGCVAISDDGLTVQNARLMRIAMDYAKSFGLPVTTHSIEANLAKSGHMNESVVSTRLGITGSPAAAEDVIIARDILLAELTGAHLHVGHLSTKGGIRMVEEAKQRGIPVTCEVTPHHFTLTDEAITDYDTNLKMCPPLRSAEDVQAIKDALKKGGIVDAIATDHAPHGLIDKQVEFDKAAWGIIGFETALPLSLQLVRDGYLTMGQMVELFTSKPAKVFSLAGGSLKVGEVADVTIFDPQAEWSLTSETIHSKSKNSPFLNQTMTGQVKQTIVAGKLRYTSTQGPMA